MGDHPRFSVDLVADALKHIEFLRGVHKQGVTLQNPSCESLHRYVDLWLPMVAKKGDRPLIPPPDIAWFWHCHRLAPYEYENYVMKRFGKIVEANPPFQFQAPSYQGTHSEASISSMQCWATDYPNEPFFIESKQDCQTAVSDKICPCKDFLDGFDLLSSTLRQVEFLWQISRPCFQDLDFLKEAVFKYYCFLKLPVSHLPNVPTYQIDLIWHTHMLSSLSKYHSDCLKIRHHKLNHDDSLNDRAPGSKLYFSCEETKRKWSNAYTENYCVSGSMYRGEPPLEFYDSDWDAVRAAAPGSCDGDAADPSLNILLAAASISSGSNVPSYWIPLSALETPDRSRPTFIKGLGYSSKQKDNYIYGLGPNGSGYYHIYTKEAYVILLTRLQKREQFAAAEFGSYECQHCLCCCPGKMTPGQEQEKENLRKRYIKIRNTRALVQAQLETDGPGRDVEQAQVEKFGGVQLKTTSRNQGSMDDAAALQYYYISTNEICAAGGCGGGVGAGGGCGGGGES